MDEKTQDELLHLIEEGKDLEAIKRIVESHPGTLNEDYGCGTWLENAAADPNLDVVKLLVELGSDVNHVCFLEGVTGGTTALSNAIIWGMVDNAKYLLANSAVPNDEYRVMLTAINSAPREKRLEFVKLLHEHGSDVHRTYIHRATNKKMNALGEAQGNPEIVSYLENLGCKLPDQKAGGNE